MQERTGLWVSEGGKLEIRQLPALQASALKDDEYLIRVLYSGINPADQKHSIFLGISNLVAGYDFVGEVIAKANDSLPLELGALVCGLSRQGNEEFGLYGAHQQFLVASTKGVFALPPNPTQVDLGILATIPVTTATAADCLFGLLKFDVTPSARNKVPLLIWGGSSAVGNAIIQFAHQAGIGPILVTASAKHHDALLCRGATHCFDYHNADSLKDDISRVMAELPADEHPGRHIQYAIDATGMNEADIKSICESSESTTQIVSTVGGGPGTLKPSASVFYGEDVLLGGGRLVPARLADGIVVAERIRWAIDNLGTRFHQVPVRVLDGKWPDLVENVAQIAKGGISFGKIVFKMPQN